MMRTMTLGSLDERRVAEARARANVRHQVAVFAGVDLLAVTAEANRFLLHVDERDVVRVGDAQMSATANAWWSITLVVRERECGA
ncbi:MAG: hypothetical protein IT337_15425 [Thermomicrobiales bacterium]|nr:hypothetical protein [Thermomicrobiales bacterium]